MYLLIFLFLFFGWQGRQDLSGSLRFPWLVFGRLLALYGSSPASPTVGQKDSTHGCHECALGPNTKRPIKDFGLPELGAEKILGSGNLGVRSLGRWTAWGVPELGA